MNSLLVALLALACLFHISVANASTPSVVSGISLVGADSTIVFGDGSGGAVKLSHSSSATRVSVDGDLAAADFLLADESNGTISLASVHAAVVALTSRVVAAETNLSRALSRIDTLEAELAAARGRVEAVEVRVNDTNSTTLGTLEVQLTQASTDIGDLESSTTSALSTLTSDVGQRVLQSSGSVTLRTDACAAGEVLCDFADGGQAGRVLKFGPSHVVAGLDTLGQAKSFSLSGASTSSQSTAHNHEFGYLADTGGNWRGHWNSQDRTSYTSAVSGNQAAGMDGMLDHLAASYDHPNNRVFITNPETQSHSHTVTGGSVSVSFDPRYVQLLACCTV